MKTQLLNRVSLVLALAVGCAQNDDEVSTIANDLELENGGLDMADEAPAFGVDEEFVAAAAAPETDVTDPMATDPEVTAIMDGAAGEVYGVTVLWGQLPGNLENETARVWSGALRVNRGGIIVRRVIRFEDATDRLLPRDDRAVVPFTSWTRPHNDGLRLIIVDPTPEAADPLVLSYLPIEGERLDLSVAALVDEPQSHEVDDAGNRIVAAALRGHPDRCAHGFLGGRWHRVAEGRGRLIGRVTDGFGAPIGHLRGLYGVRESGEHVFFGKYIGIDGGFRGIFGGHYGEGHFEGRWGVASGDRGALRGEYRESLPGPEVGGHFLGRWAETTCGL